MSAWVRPEWGLSGSRLRRASLASHRAPLPPLWKLQPARVGRALLPDQLQETWAQLQLQLSSGMHLELAQGLRDRCMRSQVGEQLL